MLEKADQIMATYVEAADQFGKSATEFLRHVSLLRQAWNHYQQAVAASAELRSVLDKGDENLRTLMTQLEDAINTPLGKAVAPENKLEALKAEVMKATAASAGGGNSGGGVKALP